MPRHASPEPTTIRRFTLLDAIAVVAAIAIGLVGVRSIWIQVRLLDRPDGGWTWLAVVGRIPLLLLIVMPCFTTLTIALLLLRFRKPRPRLRRLFLQPGAATCGAVFLAWLLVTGTALTFGVINRIWGNGTVFIPAATGLEEAILFSLRMGTPDSTGAAAPVLAVLVAWSLLLMIGRCRGERTWIDRAGRAVGVIWLLVGLAWFYAHCLTMCEPSWIAPIIGEETKM